MSPITSRVAVRMVGRRNYTVFSAVRSFARSLESHPFERLPVTQRAAVGDWANTFKKSGATLVRFVPAIGFFLTWPLWAKALLDGKVGSV